MSDDVRAALGALTGLRTALRQYLSESADVAAATGRAVADSRRDVADEVTRRRVALRAAEDAWRACASRPNARCDAEAALVEHARRRLGAAERALRLVDDAATTLFPAQQRYARETTARAAEALKLLSEAVPDLEQYLNSGGVGSAAGAGGSRTGTAGGAAPSLPGGATFVPLDRIDDGDSRVRGPEQFTKGYSPEDLRWSFDALHEVVLPAASRGLGLDYFRDRDAREGRCGTRSLAACYDGFFGLDAITLRPRGDGRYAVANGYHRIWVARQSGLATVPARVEA